MPAWARIRVPSLATAAFSLFAILTLQTAFSSMMRYTVSPRVFAMAGLASLGCVSAQASNSTADLAWHAPASSDIDDLSNIMNRTGIYNFIFNSSTTPDSVPYSTYNWCNMPHVRKQEYPKANSSYQLEYVEIIHRHHKRTPYAANTFPVETYAWSCSDEGLFYSGAHLPYNAANTSAQTYWSVFNDSSNPLKVAGFPGTCQFPQITSGGLLDSRQHGIDLASVYIDLLSFLPTTYDPATISFRVSNNVITSQVASSLIPGYYPALSTTPIPLLIQPPSIDSLEPAYTCPTSSSLYSSYASGSTTGLWAAHLNISRALSASLDTLSGVSPTASDWHVSWDHYFDNLSARLCHGYPLPCSANNTSLCVTEAQAENVFRLGEWEYSYTYRAAGPQTLQAGTASYGVFVAEFAAALRSKAGLGRPEDTARVGEKMRLRHNLAHDGSISRLLSVLQIERMVWPGMGAEVVFELFSKAGAGGYGEVQGKEYFLRVLWGGQVLRSSSPQLGVMDMVPLQKVLDYFDGLVGTGGVKVPGLCGR